jgi:hypothetical protein
MFRDQNLVFWILKHTIALLCSIVLNYVLVRQGAYWGFCWYLDSCLQVNRILGLDVVYQLRYFYVMWANMVIMIIVGTNLARHDTCEALLVFFTISFWNSIISFRNIEMAICVLIILIFISSGRRLQNTNNNKFKNMTTWGNYKIIYI